MPDYSHALRGVSQDTIDRSRRTGDLPYRTTYLVVARPARVEVHEQVHAVTDEPPAEVLQGRVRRYYVSPKTRLTGLLASLQEGGRAAALVERVLRGLSVTGKGLARTGVLTDDAQAAEGALARLLACGEAGEARPRRRVYSLAFHDQAAAIGLARRSGADIVYDDDGRVVWRRDEEEIDPARRIVPRFERPPPAKRRSRGPRGEEEPPMPIVDLVPGTPYGAERKERA